MTCECPAEKGYKNQAKESKTVKWVTINPFFVNLESGIPRRRESMISVLYIDDSQLLLDVTSLFLERDRDLTVDISLTVEGAIRKLDYIDYDIIVADYLDRGQNMISLLSYLEKKGKDIPLICLSATPPGKADQEITRKHQVIFIPKVGNFQSHFDDLLNEIRKIYKEKNDRAKLDSDTIPLINEEQEPGQNTSHGF